MWMSIAALSAILVAPGGLLLLKIQADMATQVEYADNPASEAIAIDLGKTLALMGGISIVQIIMQMVLSGAITYLVKPVELGQLNSAVETAIARADEVGKLLRSVDKLSVMNENRRSISIAVGIIMERYSLSDSEAFEILRYLARSRREQMAITAETLVEGRGGLDLLVKVSKYIARLS